jgi:uncharacterized protein (DUF58 family)
VQLSPTFPTRILGVLALLILIAALFALDAVAFAWGAALIIGLTVSRLLTQQSIARARIAGFEMLWRTPQRNSLVVREGEMTLRAELRNRSNVLIMLESISALCPPELKVEVEPTRGILPARCAFPIELRVRALRVGLHGIQGLTVVVRNDNSAFEAELTFANPHVMAVAPSTSAHPERQWRGGLGRVSAPANRTSRFSGEALELRELREHQPGDALRKVAWKASARRGRLLVRDDEQEHRHRLWFVLDASVELWAGRPGESALDLAIDRVASLMRQALRRGDRVGLCVVAARILARVDPDQGQNHERRLFDVLSRATATADFDRSGLDEQDAASIVLDHLRPMDPAGARQLSATDLDAIAQVAERLLSRTELAAQPEPAGTSARDRVFRRYLATFGLPTPPRTTPDRDHTDQALLETLAWLASTHPDRIRICSPWPRPRLLEGLAKVQGRLRRSRIELDWLPINIHYGMPCSSNVAHQLVYHTLLWRSLVAAKAGSLALRRLGIRSVAVLPATRANAERIP